MDNGFDTTTTTTGCVDQTFTTDGTFTASCSASNTIGSAGPVVVDGQARRDGAGDDGGARADRDRRLVLAADGHPDRRRPGLRRRLDELPPRRRAVDSYLGPFFVASFGPHTVDFRSTDVAGNVEATKTTSWGCGLPGRGAVAGLSDFVAGLGLDNGLTTACSTA